MPVRIAFEGEYASLMDDYVAFRQNLGFVMPESSQRRLRLMADVLYGMPLVPEVIDMERAEAIAAKRKGESGRTRQGRFVVLRQFCIHLNRIGIRAYVPPAGQVKARNDFIPRIVGEEETARTVKVAEGKALHWPPMALKILWCTGLRIGEVAALAVGDFHRDQRSLFVAHAKNDRSRTVPVSGSLARALGDYIDAHVPGGDLCRWPFPGKDPGIHRGKKAMGNKLRAIYREAGVLADEGRSIRTHDIRHSFAIRALENTAGQGRDAYVTLPLLSAFMGHANIHDAEHCLRFLPSARLALLDRQAPISNAVRCEGVRAAAERLSAGVRPETQEPAREHGQELP